MADFIVGLTGGIGSGKTAVSDRFAALGVKVVDADVASRVVVEPGQPALKAIAAHFGEHIIGSDGGLDRAALRKIVFAQPEERTWLEQLTHPLINAYIKDELGSAESDYAMLAHPLLVETKQYHICNRVLAVDVPETLQIERTMARDGNDRNQVEAIIAAQATREQRLEVADDVLVNDQDLAHIDAEVSKLHKRYQQLALDARKGN